MAVSQPFPLPRKLPPRFASVHQYWKVLIRAENPIPFSDDVNLSRLEKLSANLLLIDVFSAPQRFRFNHLGERIIKKFGANVVGKFMDELEPSAPFNFLIAQASVTVEAQAPTLYSNASGGKKTRDIPYLRIILPAWGNGRVDLLLGAII